MIARGVIMQASGDANQISVSPTQMHGLNRRVVWCIFWRHNALPLTQQRMIQFISRPTERRMIQFISRPTPQSMFSAQKQELADSQNMIIWISYFPHALLFLSFLKHSFCDQSMALNIEVLFLARNSFCGSDRQSWAFSLKSSICALHVTQTRLSYSKFSLYYLCLAAKP